MAFTGPKLKTDPDSGITTIVTKGGAVIDCCCGGFSDLVFLTLQYNQIGAAIMYPSVSATWQVLGLEIAGFACPSILGYIAKPLVDPPPIHPLRKEIWSIDAVQAKLEGEWTDPSVQEIEIHSYWGINPYDPSWVGGDMLLTATYKGNTVNTIVSVNEQNTGPECAHDYPSYLQKTLRIQANGSLSFV